VLFSHGLLVTMGYVACAFMLVAFAVLLMTRGRC